jgi:hypothetical protein
MPLPTLDPRFYWFRSTVSWVLMWDGLACGWVTTEGQYRADWRGHRHAGQMASAALARKMMERWFAARQHRPPRDKRSKRYSMNHLWWPSTGEFLSGQQSNGLGLDDDEDLAF